MTEPGDLRASDADRERYAEVLGEAFAEGRLDPEEYEERLDAVYRAKTFGELSPLVADLPTGEVVVPSPSTALALPASSNAPVLAIFSEAKRRDNWLVEDGQTAVAVFGSVMLDLSACTLRTTDIEIRAVAILGEVQILVPDTMDVTADGMAILGDFDRHDERPDKVRGTPAAPNAPRIRVTGLALLGSVTVKIISATSAVQIRPPEITS